MASKYMGFRINLSTYIAVGSELLVHVMDEPVENGWGQFTGLPQFSILTVVGRVDLIKVDALCNDVHGK